MRTSHSKGAFTYTEDAGTDRGREILERRRRMIQAREDVRHAEYELAKAQAWLAHLEQQEKP